MNKLKKIVNIASGIVFCISLALFLIFGILGGNTLYSEWIYYIPKTMLATAVLFAMTSPFEKR